MSNGTNELDILKHLDRVTEINDVEEALELAFLALKKSKRYKFIIAGKCNEIIDYKKVDISYNFKLWEICKDFDLPSFFMVHLTKKIILINKNENLSVPSEFIDVLSKKYPTRSAEQFIRNLNNNQLFKFDKNYEEIHADAISRLSNGFAFEPKKHVALFDNSKIFYDGINERNTIDLMLINNGCYFYTEGEFLILKDKKVAKGSLDSAYCYNKYLEAISKEHSERICLENLLVIRNYTPPRNYSHWLSDYLPFINWFNDFFKKKFTIIFHEPIAKYQKESLDFIEHAHYIIAPEKKIIVAENIYFFSTLDKHLHPANFADPILLASLQSMKNKISSNNEKLVNIYLSRSKADRRKLINEEKLVNELINHDFQIINAEDLSWQQQVNVFSKAKNIISVHGAGLTNAIFSEKCEKLIEIFPKDYGTAAFQIIADSMGIDYYYCKESYNQPIIELGNQFSDVEMNIDFLISKILETVY